MSAPPPALVYLVGAGPGDAGLITLRGCECLRRADVVLYDYLVNPRIVEHAPAAAERICLGQHGRTRIWSQAEINAYLIEHSRAGRCVVRLKGGDPAVFARTAEELEALTQAGIPFEVVPGITAALAASSYAGIPLTHRDHASAVAFVTGQEGPDKETSALDYPALARFPGTLVFYMGVTTAGHWSSALIAAGKPATTPAAIVRRATLPDQQTIHCTLGEIADRLTPASKLRPPVLVIVGEVARPGANFDWFARRPLFGQTVLVTRPAEQAGELRGLLEEQGAGILLQPAIRIEPPEDWGPVDAAIRDASRFDWLVFSSANGVTAWFDRLEAIGLDARQLGGVRIAVMGPGTAEALGKYRLKPDLVPRAFHAEALAAELAPAATGKRFLLLRASRGREVLAEELTRAGGAVEQVVVYASRDVAEPDPWIAERLAASKIDWITVTSSAIARNLVRLFGEHLRRSKLVSISPITSQTLREIGHEPTAEAREYTMAGIVRVIEEIDRS